MIIQNYNFPDDRLYWYSPPHTFLWIKNKKDFNKEIAIQIGLTDIFAKKIDKISKITFRSENLKLRKDKTFLVLYTKKQVFKFVSPVSTAFSINENVKKDKNIIRKDPYNEYLIICSGFNQNDSFFSKFKKIQEYEEIVKEMLNNMVYEGCELCPDLFNSKIVRRNS